MHRRPRWQRRELAERSAMRTATPIDVELAVSAAAAADADHAEHSVARGAREGRGRDRRTGLRRYDRPGRRRHRRSVVGRARAPTPCASTPTSPSSRAPTCARPRRTSRVRPWRVSTNRESSGWAVRRGRRVARCTRRRQRAGVAQRPGPEPRCETVEVLRLSPRAAAPCSRRPRRSTAETTPACPSGPVIEFLSGRYNAIETAKMNNLLDGSPAPTGRSGSAPASTSST